MADPVKLSLPSFVVAPDATGRGYELSTNADLRDRWTVDLPMVMLAWSQRNIEQPFACSIDFGEGLVVCRGHFLRKLASGNSIALLAGVVITNAEYAKINFRTDLLAASIPLPSEGTDFSASPHHFEFAGSGGKAKAWPSDALSWGRRFIRHDGDCDAQSVLAKFMDAIEPTGQHAWFRSWTTTDTLPAKGGIDFASQAQLILSLKEEPAQPPFFNAKVSGGRATDGQIELSIGEVESSGAPPSYRAYAGVLDVAREKLSPSSSVTAPSFKVPRWSLKHTNAEPVPVARRTAIKIVEQLNLRAAYGFLATMLVHKSAAIQEAGQSASMTLLEYVAKSQAWDADACQLIANLPDKEPVFKLILSGKELGHYNEKLLEGLAKIASDALSKAKLKGERLPSVIIFALEYARSAQDFNFDVDSVLGLVQSLRKDADAAGLGVGDIRDMLTPETLSIYADHEGKQLSDLTAKLMDDAFFDFSRVSSVSAALSRGSTALTAVDRMQR